MKILFVSLGCDKNLVDSEHMTGLLLKAGYEFTNDETEADIIIINSCCFINDAKEESIETIFEMAKYKEKGTCKALVLAGCLAQRYIDEIEEEIPEVDICIGTTAIDKVVESIEEFLKEKHHINTLENIDFLAGADAPRRMSGISSFAYLKIAEGCDKHCSYCIIPKVRGNYRSVPMEKLLAEAKELAQQGVKELVLVAQETSMYGKDLYGEKSLHKLLKELAKIPEIDWIRILYCYPEEIYDELIDTMAEEPKVCHYLDIPIQHGDDLILRRMGRQTSSGQLREIIGKLRKKIPDIILRTTFITGFPGETEEQHQNVLEFIDEMEFDRLGVFTYSPEENTPAATMDDQIDEEVKNRRRNEIMELQQEIVFEKMNRLVGKEFLAMIEGKISGENAYIGRTYMDTPGVDSNIFVITDAEIMTGDFVKVKVTGTYEYDLIGEPV